MQTTDLRNTVHAILQSIAPEIEPAELDAAAPLRDQIDLDSMDYLNFIVGMHEKLKVEIPESDYQKLVSLDDIVNYLRDKLPA
jgi:acyl carrier protein